MHYSVQILDTPFTGNRNENILGRDKTVIVKIIKGENKVTEHRYGYVEAKQIFELIRLGKEINLNRAYIKNFSLNEYRKAHDLIPSHEVILGRINANKAFFDADADFSNACFYDNVDFSNSRFGEGNVNFSGSSFQTNQVSFGGVRFGNGNVLFTRAQFSDGETNFGGAAFGDGDIIFNGAEFGNGNIIFSAAEFGVGNVYFYLTKVGTGTIDFSRSKLTQSHVTFHSVKLDSINFSKNHMQKLKFINCTFKDFADLRMHTCEDLELEDCIIENNFNIRSSQTQKVDIHQLKLTNIINLGQIHVDWEKNKVKQMIYSQGEGTSFCLKAEQFRLLKQNFQSCGQYVDEDKAYLEFKRCERKADYFGENVEDNYKGFFKKAANVALNPLKWLVFDKIGHYGTNPLNVFITMLVTIFLFSVIYTLFPGLVAQDRILHGALSGVYLSVETFLTIGYGDIYPSNGLGLILSGIEGFMGMFLMSYFTVAFVRKTLR